jgi:hypothetical protein
MADDDTFSRLMSRLRSGEDAAAWVVFERFAGRLVALDRQPRPEEAVILAEPVRQMAD